MTIGGPQKNHQDLNDHGLGDEVQNVKIYIVGYG